MSQEDNKNYMSVTIVSIATLIISALAIYLLVNIFSDKGRHTRFAVGSNSLPLDISVEIEAIIKLK